VQVVHGAEGVHGMQRVAVHPVVLHGERSLPAGSRRRWLCVSQGAVVVELAVFYSDILDTL